MTETLKLQDPEFVREVEARSDAPVSACYQCHKCSTGCPIGPDMDLLSSQIMRLIQLGQESDVLESQAIWLCASCEACSSRCPMDIDVAAVMDALRIMAVERKADFPNKKPGKFNKAFLSSVRSHGRVYEFGMMANYKLRSGDLLSDADKVPTMLRKGKLSLFPKRSGCAKEVREVFRRAEEEEEKKR